eukprot:TRINITY_DN3594_c0_g1_i1.p1 TRINITY_DN3594_c0_g1~~TRINITY_DN3594_c0_g1_i1.p1  ORF type:complete len:439 (-),score=115.15 TRINITY_DN3594_c0_g1_i1:144-1460(-)
MANRASFFNKRVLFTTAAVVIFIWVLFAMGMIPIHPFPSSGSNRPQVSSTSVTPAPTQPVVATAPVEVEVEAQEVVNSATIRTQRTQIKPTTKPPTPSVEVQDDDFVVKGQRREKPVKKARRTAAPETPAPTVPAVETPNFDKSPFGMVIVNYNEPLLVVTVHALLEISPAELIGEVLILDDASDPPVQLSWFNEDPRIRIVRSEERLGLIKARYVAGNAARAPFLIFLDAHVKPHAGWLLPIQKLLQQNYKTIVNMEVGILNATSFTPMPNSAIGNKASFTNKLEQYWEPDHNPDDDTSPMTMGMFGITRKWWLEIGGMDPGLQTWGGENIEISLRSWLCGGQVKVARGAYIDHAFRTSFPYPVGKDDLSRNLVRVAEAWLDPKSLKEFYEATGTERGTVDFGDLSEVRAVQKRLKCKSFQGYRRRFKGRAFTPKMP